MERVDRKSGAQTKFMTCTHTIIHIHTMIDKPVKHGIKVFVLADGKYAYIKRIQIYTGKNSSLSQNELGLSSQVVLDLMSGLENRHHKLYIDNYYTSPILVVKLYQNNTYACGTARTHRKNYPAELAIQSH